MRIQHTKQNSMKAVLRQVFIAVNTYQRTREISNKQRNLYLRALEFKKKKSKKIIKKKKSPDSKSSGPDGFNSGFYQTFKKSQCFTNYYIKKERNSTNSKDTTQNYRPIYLITIEAKILNTILGKQNLRTNKRSCKLVQPLWK